MLILVRTPLKIWLIFGLVLLGNSSMASQSDPQLYSLIHNDCVASLSLPVAVEKFMGCDIARIIAQAEQVNSFKVKGLEDTNLPASQKLGPFPIEASGANLNPAQIGKLQQLIFDEHSYVFGAEKRCRFQPEMGLRFIQGNNRVDLLISLTCSSWLFVRNEQQLLEDFDPVAQDLQQLYSDLFAK
jgi:hypothetical protein